MRTQVQHHSLQRKSGNSPNVERMSQLWSAHAAGRRLALERNEAPTHGTARPSLARFSSQATPGIGDSPEVESRSQKLGGEGTASDCRGDRVSVWADASVWNQSPYCERTKRQWLLPLKWLRLFHVIETCIIRKMLYVHNALARAHT